MSFLRMEQMIASGFIQHPNAISSQWPAGSGGFGALLLLGFSFFFDVFRRFFLLIHLLFVSSFCHGFLLNKDLLFMVIFL